MRKICSILLSIIVLLSFSLAPSYSAEDSEDIPQRITAPLSPAFIEWQKRMQSMDEQADSEAEHEASPVRNDKSGGITPTGYIPFPIDLSYLADNPPRENLSPVPNYKASAASSKYDMRDDNLLPSVKNQNPYDTCWAHASIGAMESNYIKQGYPEIELSEMHLAYFSFINSTKSKAYGNISSFTAAMGHGGNALYPTGLYTRLDGPVLESDVKYENGQPLKSSPESYTRILRLKDVYYMSMVDSGANVNSQRAVIKQRIIDNGAVMASYYHADNGYNKTSSGGTAYHTKSQSTNHAVQIVGWDDNYSASNFKSGSRPSSNGAWLMKNSWGTVWGDDGYFWMSYESYLVDGTAFVVEPVNSDLKCYYYDALGWCGSSGWTGVTNSYAANSFKATRSGEKLIEVGLFAPDNNFNYEITVYTDQGTTMPSSSPTGGTKAHTESGTIPYAGYHTIVLNRPVALTQNQYFSVVVKYAGQSMIPVEQKVSGLSNNASIESGSFFSYNGTSWETSSEFKGNATIKAFTTSSAGDTAPTISTSTLPGGTLDVEYTAMLTAYGATPITWSLSSGSLPDGLTLDGDSGTIYGTPTEEGDFSFTVKATNSKGSATKSFSLTIYDMPVITTTAFEGYQGYAFTGSLALNTSLSAKWAAASLPKGLKLDADTGAITGKPSKAGTYNVSVTATTSAGASTATVTFVINEKPKKPAIKVKSGTKTQIAIGEEADIPLEITGTEPVSVTVSDDTMPAGLAFDSTQRTFYGTPTETGTFQMLVTASNVVNELSTTKPTTKKIKLVVKAQPPVISKDITLPAGIVDQEYAGYTVTLSSGSSPDKWKASGLPKGLTLGEKTGVISGTPKKAGKFNVKITAQNNGGKDATDKIPLVIYMIPEINVKKLKDGVTDKAYSVKLTIKGEPSSVSVVNLPTGLSLSQDKKGNYLITGTPTTVETRSVVITATNDAGTAQVTLPLVVKGVAPKISAKLAKGTAGEEYSAEITVTGTKPLTEFSHEITEADQAKYGISSLSELGLTLTTDLTTGEATLSGTPVYSVKGLPIYITAQNAMGTATKKFSLKISGTKPAFTTPSDAKYTVSGTAGSTVTVNFVVTGTEKITYSMKNTAGFTLTQDETDPHKATLTVTIPAKKVSITITAANADGKATKKVEITPSSSGTTGTLPENLGVSPEPEEPEETPEDSAEPEELTETPERETSPEPVMTFGETQERESAAKRAETDGCEAAAVLPELSVNVSGMYDLEVELDESVETGRELVWLACPKNAEPSEDDEIVEFYDENGEEIESVPESHVLRISVWLTEGVIYEPVIAVK